VIRLYVWIDFCILSRRVVDFAWFCSYLVLPVSLLLTSNLSMTMTTILTIIIMIILVTSQYSNASESRISTAAQIIPSYTPGGSNMHLHLTQSCPWVHFVWPDQPNPSADWPNPTQPMDNSDLTRGSLGPSESVPFHPAASRSVHPFCMVHWYTQNTHTD